MRALFAPLLLFGCLLAGASPVRAADQPSGIFVAPPRNVDDCAGDNSPDQMQFSLVNVSHGKAFFAWGGIDDGDTQRFLTALKAAGPIEEVILCSPGGSLEDGIDMGYVIRDRKLATRVPSGYFCISACNFVFMGGIIRTIDPGAHFMVHMFAAGKQVAEALRKDATTEDWTIGDYALSHPDGMVGLENDPDFESLQNDYSEFSIDFAKDHNTEIQADFKQYSQDHPQDKLSINAFLKTDIAKALITSDVLRAFAVQEDIKQIEQSSAQQAAEIAEFLVRMELSLHFLTAFANIPNDAPRDLTEAELIEYNIVNTQ
ncbi:MAG TPA: hypothetical protein VMA37_13685 [Acetobacteraceae bacterium]|nr:hypothetical protein [Acetobacteraceae bacterium]